MKHRAVFLDRDGVLNQVILKNGKPYPPANLEELVIPEEVLPALQILKSLHYLLIVVTNQPDVARGTISLSIVQNINTKLLKLLPLDDVRVCYHDDSDGCTCRKPAAGLLLQAALDHDIDLEKSFMIGDRWKDVEAGQRAACKTVWLDNQYEENEPKRAPDYTTNSLMQAVMWIKNIRIKDTYESHYK
jgi:D-glycero-D-manno-heptose 1,7-bisphosphate phosphatase